MNSAQPSFVLEFRRNTTIGYKEEVYFKNSSVKKDIIYTIIASIHMGKLCPVVSPKEQKTALTPCKPWGGYYQAETQYICVIKSAFNMKDNGKKKREREREKARKRHKNNNSISF